MSDKKFALLDFVEIRTIGTGSFGRVKLVKSKKEKGYFALKILRKENIIQLRQVDHIYSEYIILNEIKHPFIVNLISMNQDEKMIYFLLEYVAGGELFTLIRSEGTLHADQVKFFAAQIISIFDYLHSKNIVYRDLKPENILITTNGYLKMTDFGFAKKVMDKTYTLCGTPEYMAPEIIMNKGHSKPVDWWTLGILIYEMIVGIDPFNDEDPMMTYKNIIQGKYRFPPTVNKNAKSFIKHLLVADQTMRFGSGREGVNSIYRHKWFKHFDWNSLLMMTLPAFYIPKIRSLEDTSHFSEYPDSETEVVALSSEIDPFLDW